MQLIRSVQEDYKAKEFRLVILDYELASIHLSSQEQQIVSSISPDSKVSDCLLALAVIARKIEETVRPKRNT